MRALLIIAVIIWAVGTPLSAQPGGDRAISIKPGETCPPGMTEIRPRQCLPPQDPAPSILDYRPHSTLVVLPGVGHIPQIEDVKLFNQRVADVLTANRPAR